VVGRGEAREERNEGRLGRERGRLRREDEEDEG
jgi:hypothetical protein